MSTLDEIYAKADWWDLRRERAQKRKAAAEKTIEYSYRHLGPTRMIEEIAAALAPHFPNQVLNVLGPFGLGHTTSIHAYPLGTFKSGKVLGSLTFRPGERNRLVMVDYSTQSDLYPPGSLGYVNGLNYAEVEMPASIAELVELLWASIQKQEASR